MLRPANACSSRSEFRVVLPFQFYKRIFQLLGSEPVRAFDVLFRQPFYSFFAMSVRPAYQRRGKTIGLDTRAFQILSPRFFTRNNHFLQAFYLRVVGEIIEHRPSQLADRVGRAVRFALFSEIGRFRFHFIHSAK